MDAEVLGRQILKKRKEKDWSQEELGKLADISRNYVSQIERGEAKSISIKVINRLAYAFGISPSELEESPSLPVMIPQSLAQFAIEKKKSYEVIEKLANIPRRGKEPQTVEQWQQLYETIKQFIEQDL